MNKYKYYIKLNENDEVIDAYSDGQREPDKGDICVAQGFERCFSYNCYDHEHFGVPLRKYDRKSKRFSLLSKQEKENHPAVIQMRESTDIEALIQKEIREMAVERLKEKGVLDKNGNLKR